MSVEVTQVGPGSWALSFRTSAAAPAVFDYVADLSRHTEWEPALSEVEHTGGEASRAGASYVKWYGARPRGLLSRMFSDTVVVDCEILAADRPGRVEWQQSIIRKGADGHDRQHVVVTIVPDGDGCTCEVVRTPGDATSVHLVAGFAGGAGELVGRALEGAPARGPGPVGLERFREITVGWSDRGR